MNRFNRMIKPVLFCSLLTMTPVSILSAAEDNSPLGNVTAAFRVSASAVSIHIDDSVPDNSKPEFSLAAASGVTLGYSVLPWVAVEAGYTQQMGTESDEQTDIAGSYTTELYSEILTAGLNLRLMKSESVELFSRIGGLKYSTELTVHERFDDVYPEGEVSAWTSGNGYYLGLGIRNRSSNGLMFSGAVEYHRLTEAFADSSRPFDISYTGLTLGVGF